MTSFFRKWILRVPIYAIPLNTISYYICSLISSPGKKNIFYVNAHCLNIANRDEDYRRILCEATLVYSGGLGPVLASRILNKHLPERTPTPDFIDKIFSVAQKKNWSFYFVGSSEVSLRSFVKKIKRRFPTLKVSGSHNGYFDQNEEMTLLQDINSKKPTIVLVGMGAPKQEKWVARNFNKIDAKVLWTVGALFDVISGHTPRAPKFIQGLGLEWLHRFSKEPRRLWRRYTFGNFNFLYLIIKELIHNHKNLR